MLMIHIDVSIIHDHHYDDDDFATTAENKDYVISSMMVNG